MSLKAKIEAIIYAAEEPVTLAQLASLLAEETATELEKQAAASAQAQAEAEAAQADGELLPATAADETEPELLAAEAVAELQAAEEPAAAPDRESSEAEVEAAIQAAETTAPLLADVEAAEKKAAKEQERKVRDCLRQTIDELISDYAKGERGMEIREVAGGYRMATKPEYHDAVRSFVKSLKPPMKLSLQALETLAVVAYKQPITAPEVSEIRGVDSGGVLGSLISRKLVATAGRKQVIGRPILYKTTKEFLLRFGLKDLGELPSIEEFEKMAGELAEQEGLPLTDEVASEAMHSETAELDAPVEDAAELLATDDVPIEARPKTQPDSEEPQIAEAEAPEVISAPEAEESKANA